MLGPLVVATTLALLGSGLALIALGDGPDQDVLLTAFGQRLSSGEGPRGQARSISA